MIFHVNPLLGRQKFNMKHQALFSSKDKSKKNKSGVCCNLLGSLSVKRTGRRKKGSRKMKVVQLFP